MSQLSKKDLDALMVAARSAQPHVPAAPRNVTKWSAQEAGRLSEEQVRALTGLHEKFAARLTSTLGSYLRVTFSAQLAGIEQSYMRQYAQNFQAPDFIASFRASHDGVGLLQINQALTLPTVDILLGGSGAGVQPSRELSEIDEDIIADLARSICSALQTTWKGNLPELVLGERLSVADAMSVFPPNERLVSIALAVDLLETKGEIRILLSRSLVNALLRNLSSPGGQHRPQTNAGHAAQLRQRLMKSSFVVELGLAQLKVPVRTLLELRAGSVLQFNVPVRTPASLLLGSQIFFEAVPARLGNCRAAHLGASTSVKHSSEIH